MKKKVTFVIEESIYRELKIASAIHDINQSDIVQRGIVAEIDRMGRSVGKTTKRKNKVK